jgi:hypothetical protein
MWKPVAGGEEDVVPLPVDRVASTEYGNLTGRVDYERFLLVLVLFH